jgi:methylglutaconyl-CoA hydratase
VSSATPVWEQNFDTLLLAADEDLLWVTLNDPGHANALSPQMIAELTTVYSAPLRSLGIRGLLLQAEGKHFSAGADLKHLESLLDAGKEQNRQDSALLRGLFEAVLHQQCLTVALVQGACVAGGCGLATAHDFVVASEDARFLYSEVRIGFVAALVATFLTLRVRGADLRELLLFPEFIGADRALAIGLVNRISPREELTVNARQLATKILANGSSESIARTKDLLLQVIGLELDGAMARAAEVNAQARGTEDCKRGISTFLSSKSAPTWREPN